MVPIPQTGIAGTLNLSEELFSAHKQQRYETQTGGKQIAGEGMNKKRGESKEGKRNETGERANSMNVCQVRIKNVRQIGHDPC